MNSPEGRRRPRREWLALLAIAAPFAIGWALVSPWQNVPVIDDWVYAWSVEHLLKTGQLRVAEISAIYPIAQVLWGAMFARVAGFSFGALRLSTIVLAVSGCWALYLMLRELGINVTNSLLAALTMAWHPVYFALAFTFMSDVPFVALTCVSLFFYVSAVRRASPRRLWWGSLWAVLAFLVRSVAIVLPVAVLAAVIHRRHSERAVGGPLSYVPPIAAALGVMAALFVIMPRAFGVLSGQALRMEGLKWWFMVTPSEYGNWNANLALIATFPLAPVLLRTLTTRRTAAIVGGVAVAVALILFATLHAVPTPLPNWQTWSLQDIGSRAMFGGTLNPSAWSVRVTPFVKFAGLIVLAGAVVAAAMAARRSQPAARVLLALGVLNFVLMNVLWFYNDRYYLVLIPTLAYVAAAVPSGRAGTWTAAVVLTVWAFVSTTGVRDMLATNAVCERLAADLESEGVPPSEIDAGYVSNGWRLYAHPENLPPDADRRYDVPYVTSGRKTMYRIVNAPEPGYDVVRSEILPAALWQVSNRLYVIRKR